MKKSNIKVEIHVKRKPYRNDAMFYYDKHIATVSKGDRKLFVEATGEMEACFSAKGKQYAGAELAKQLVKRQYTDAKLSKLGPQDFITFNNWFRITDSETNGEVGIVGTYDDAIQFAKDTLKNEE